MGFNGFLQIQRACGTDAMVGDLARLRRASTGGFGIRAGTITADHVGARMNGELFVDGAGFSVRELIDRTVSSISTRTVPFRCRLRNSKVVNAEHRHHTSGWVRRRSDHAQQGRASDGSSQRRRQPRTRMSSQRASDPLQNSALQRLASYVSTGQAVDTYDARTPHCSRCSRRRSVVLAARRDLAGYRLSHLRARARSRLCTRCEENRMSDISPKSTAATPEYGLYCGRIDLDVRQDAEENACGSQPFSEHQNDSLPHKPTSYPKDTRREGRAV